jgi:hypothetical protein
MIKRMKAQLTSSKPTVKEDKNLGTHQRTNLNLQITQHRIVQQG